MTLFVSKLIFLKKIWDRSLYNSFPDLIRFQDKWFVVFRESEKHDVAPSKIVIITSYDCESWKEVAGIAVDDLDLRDPKFSIMPDGKLMLNVGRLDPAHKDALSSMVCFSKDGISWSEPISILNPGEWLWRLTWHEGIGYGATYRLSKSHATLYRTRDGLTYEKLLILPIEGMPTECTVHFFDDGKMAVIARRDDAPFGKAAFLKLNPPYREAAENSLLDFHLGGPNFLIINSKLVIAGRFLGLNSYGFFERMGILHSGKIFYLPGTGDLGYPGLFWHEDKLYVCYYATENHRAVINFAILEI